MLGRLARDLRLLGWDAELAGPDEPDEEVLRRALFDVVGDPDPSGFLTRCSVCNVSLVGAGGQAARAHEAVQQAGLPQAAREASGEVRGRLDCGRVYWQGTHVADMRRRLGLDPKTSSDARG